VLAGNTLNGTQELNLSYNAFVGWLPATSTLIVLRLSIEPAMLAVPGLTVVPGRNSASSSSKLYQVLEQGRVKRAASEE
jgi:hypothetical protein